MTRAAQHWMVTLMSPEGARVGDALKSGQAPDKGLLLTARAAAGRVSKC